MKTTKKENRLKAKEFSKILHRAYKYYRSVLYYKVITPENFNNSFKYTTENYNTDIDYLLKFDGNNIWAKEFWGLGVNDSICAVASEISQLYNDINQFHNFALLRTLFSNK